MNYRNMFRWALVIVPAVIFAIAASPGLEETEIIFNTIGDWMAGLGAVRPCRRCASRCGPSV